MALFFCQMKGDRGKKVQELLFDELWRETKRQMRSIQVLEMTVAARIQQCSIGHYTEIYCFNWTKSLVPKKGNQSPIG